MLRLKQRTKKPTRKVYRVRVKNSGTGKPPLYTPNPDSLLPYRRCFRASCRAIKPVGVDRCPVCGSLIDSTEPLVKYTVYVEEC